MPEPMDGPRRFITPVRLLLGSLALGAGLTVLGFLAGGSSASAAETPPAPSNPVGALVSNVTGDVGRLAGSVTSAVAPAVPEPVQQVVSQVVTPVTNTVDKVVEQAPVTQVVEPVASAVDRVVAEVPVVRDVLPPAPVTAVTQPVTGGVDQAVSDVVGVVDSAVAPLTPAAGSSDPLPAPDPGSSVAQGPGVDAAVALSTAPAVAAPMFLLPSAPAAVSAALSGVLAGSAAGDDLSLPAAPGGGTPGGLSGGGLPGGVSGSSGGAGPGAPAPGAAATADGFSLHASDRIGLSGAPADDTVPAAPVADHDISPD